MSNGTDSSSQFLGGGIAFPISVDSQGQMALNLYDDLVRQSILLILQTAKGERMMRPDFGSGLQTLMFAPVSGATPALVQHEVQQALQRNEPRIDVLNVQVTVDTQQSNALQISINYRVRRTDTFFNLVYPFFLERGTL
jgi:uncharacterized protein